MSLRDDQLEDLQEAHYQTALRVVEASRHLRAYVGSSPPYVVVHNFDMALDNHNRVNLELTGYLRRMQARSGIGLFDGNTEGAK